MIRLTVLLLVAGLWLCCGQKVRAQFGDDEGKEPNIRFMLSISGAPESVGDPEKDSILRPHGGPTIWRPDMPIEGGIAMSYGGQKEYVVTSKERNIDLRRGISLIKVDCNGRKIPSEELPPLRVTFSYKNSVIPEGTDFILKPKQDGPPDYGTRYPLGIKFEFVEPPGYAWTPGYYQISFQVDYAPGVKKPQIASFFFQVREIQSDKDRLNVSWYRYHKLSGKAVARADSIQMMREALPFISALIEQFPRDIMLLRERSIAHRRAYMRRGEIEDLKKAVEWMETGQSLAVLPISVGLHGQAFDREKSVRFYKSEIAVLTTAANGIDFLEKLTPKLSATDKQEVIKWAKSYLYRGVEYKAFQIIERLKIQEAIPVLLDILEHTNSTTTVTSAGFRSTVREEAWKVLQALRPEAKRVEYNPEASDAERKVSVTKLRAVLKLK